VSPPVHLVDPGALTGLDPGAELVLGGHEGRHAVSVRRARVGERLELVDGHGTRALATVTAVRPPSTLVVVVESVVVEPEPGPRLVVVQALPKGDRGETVVETLTEVGVDEVVPWRAQRSVARWDAAKAESGVARWRRTASRLACSEPMSDGLSCREAPATPGVVTAASATTARAAVASRARERLGAGVVRRDRCIVLTFRNETAT